MSYLKLCNEFSNPCLRITVVAEEPVSHIRLRYEKHLLSHVLIGLRWMLVKVGV